MSDDSDFDPVGDDTPGAFSPDEIAMANAATGQSPAGAATSSYGVNKLATAPSLAAPGTISATPAAPGLNTTSPGLMAADGKPLPPAPPAPPGPPKPSMGAQIGNAVGTMGQQIAHQQVPGAPAPLQTQQSAQTQQLLAALRAKQATGGI